MNKDLAIDGIVKCARNAENLIIAAQALFRENRPVGTALLATAIEEYGKATLIFFHAIGIFSHKSFKQMFRSHAQKRGIACVAALTGSLTVEGKTAAQKFRRTVAMMDSDSIRDGALYVDFCAGHFVGPELDVKHFIRVFRLALHLKRTFAVFSNEDSCRKLINVD
jgi:AbiV family abortive infection protein